ncbi:S8 family serine peptidase [Spirillospora sp. NBC_01491]|uniref:S8 family serine peptidase n=1 Tax=Spirillospora sp. NBC_01491 TaxID=2976007 RepID=UPI002E34E4CC|nr:S8 family serine peptidase [Spirillospora sp. NBC_01491]
MRPGRRFTALALLFVIPSFQITPAFAEPQPRSEEWWFDAWQIREKVWPLTQGEGIVVAVIDTGIEAGLPDLNGVVLPGYEYGGSQKGDGRHDYDTEKGGHGTAMAALIAGQGIGSGMVGIAPKVRVLPIAAHSVNDALTIRYAVDHGAKVINMSWSSAAAHCPVSTQTAVNYALQHDVVIVAAAGNQGNSRESSNSPANCAGVMAVGAVDADLNIWEKSTPGSNVVIAAPGVSVGSIGKDGTFNWKVNGTSQATALTSGVVALVRSRYPKMSAREVTQRVVATAKDIGPKGWDRRSGQGALIPYLALDAHVPASAPNPVYSRFDQRKSLPNASHPSPSMGSRKQNEVNDDDDRIPVAFVGVLAGPGLVAVIGFFVWMRRKK